MKRHATISETVIVVWMLLSTVAANAKDVPSAEKFLGEAIQDGRAEIQICKLALQKSSNPAVKKFAQRMIDDHTLIEGKIREVAKSKEIELPKGISVKQKATYELLKHTPAPRFDRRFVYHNVADHDDDILDFVKQANGADDVKVKTFAADTLTILKEHLQLSKDLQAQIEK